MIQMVVFDMAGTTIDEGNVVYRTLHTAINEAGVDASFEDVLLHGAGKEKLKAVKDILLSYGVVNVETANQAYEYFLSQLTSAYASLPISAQNNATELFVALQKMGIKIVLNTGYNRATAELILQKVGWQIGVHIDSLVTASDVPNNRPQPDMILLAMQQFHINNAKEVVKVGDSIIDIQEGQNAGCGLSIGITTGAHSVAQLQSASPDYIINDLMALLPLIQSENN